MEGEAEGYIAFKQPWPGIMRTVYGDHDRFEQTYFQRLVRMEIKYNNRIKSQTYTKISIVI